MTTFRIRRQPSSDPVDAEARLRARAEREARRQRVDAFLAARDAGRELTTEAVETAVDSQTIAAAAQRVADFADAALAIVEQEYQPRLACREGCAFCCRKPGVLVTAAEFVRILQAVADRFGVEDLAALAERARRYAAQVEHLDAGQSTDDSVPCPLLVNERCTVYDVRPLVCRGYNSTSADACRLAHEDGRQLVPIFSVLKDTTDGATVGVSEALQGAGANPSMLDLGGALHLVLEHRADMDAVVVAGRSALASVENPTWAADLWAAVLEAAHAAGIDVPGPRSEHSA